MPCQAVWCALYKQSGGGDDSPAGEGGWEVLGMINNYQKDLLKERVTHTNDFHRWRCKLWLKRRHMRVHATFPTSDTLATLSEFDPRGCMNLPT